MAYFVQKQGQNYRSGKTEKKAVKAYQKGVPQKPEEKRTLEKTDKMLKADPGASAEPLTG